MERQRDAVNNDGAAAPAQGKQPESSMTSRISASASGLAKDLFSNSTAQEAHAALASASSLSSKIPNGSSSSASSTWSQALPARPNGLSVGTASGGPGHSNEGFREASSTSQQGPDFDFDAFLQSQDNQGQWHEPRPTWSEEYQLQQDQTSNESWHSQFQTNGTFKEAQRIDSPWQNQNGNGTTINHDEYDDGAAVRELLSFPGSTTNYEEDLMMSDSTKGTASSLFSPNYTPQEQEIVQKIKSALPPPPQHKSIDQDHPLNLRPEFAADPHTEHALRELVEVLQSEQERAILNDTTVQKEFLADWEDVLTSYTDQVWGDMLPIVKEARSQLQEVKTGMNRLDNKAVARLRMILGHVVGAEEVATSVAARSDAALETQGTTLGTQQNLASRNSEEMAKRMAYDRHFDEMGYFNSVNHQIPNDRQRDQGAESDGSEESDFDFPTFHCPWITCHERFHTQYELFQHSKKHREYSCPHVGCEEEFKGSKQWAAHINQAHHDLLDTRLPAEEDNEM